jgi:hypothetical protein
LVRYPFISLRKGGVAFVGAVLKFTSVKHFLFRGTNFWVRIENKFWKRLRNRGTTYLCKSSPVCRGDSRAFDPIILQIESPEFVFPKKKLPCNKH